jgi:hypothetical protein
LTWTTKIRSVSKTLYLATGERVFVDASNAKPTSLSPHRRRVNGFVRRQRKEHSALRFSF